MQRSWHIWLAFSLCLAVVLAAMTWISLNALRLDRVEEQAIRQAAIEEKTRLALWRMDSGLTPLITQESSRPYFTYASFHPLDRAYNRMFAELKPDDVRVPSPLLTLPSANILLHFQVGPDGHVTSPQVPAGNERDLAEIAYATQDEIQLAEKRLEKLRRFLKPGPLMTMLPEPGNDPASAAMVVKDPPRNNRDAPQAPPQPLTNLPRQQDKRTAVGNAQPQAPQGRQEQQQAFNTIEFDQRNQAINNASSNGNLMMARPNTKLNTGGNVNVQEGLTKTLWEGTNLLLVQRTRVDGREYVQGCWLDWNHIRERLLADIRDLLPNADLQPCPARANEQEYMLAALPVRLVPGDVPAPAALPHSPVGLSLAIAWSCLLAGAIAVAVVLMTAIRLSQRRGAFVSAVTHEMRTPLTTFRLYADLLAQNMVTDARKRQSYLRRLCDEAQRLSHLVENVLAYARLSGPHRGGLRETIGLGQLVERSRERLSTKAQQCGMELVVEPADGAGDADVSVNVSAVEQILLNLIDNACKYASSGADRRIHLRIESADGQGVLRVRDHGPGLDGKHLKRLFQPFSRSAHEAAGSAPGVGLGLALSRRMARDMGGDLELDHDCREGACFVLKLPKT